jgi:predicted aspartyl protease
MKALSKILKSKGYVSHNLNISKKSGHLVTKASINGHTGRFIIDTGASATVVDRELYKEFKLETQYMERALGTASGSLRPRISHGNTLELGEWADEDTTLLTMDMTYINEALKKERMHSVQGLLGADFLLYTKAIIDYQGKKIYLKL